MTPIRLRPKRWAIGLLAAGVIGAGAAGCSVTRQQEIEIGRQYAAQINQELPLVRDRAANQYINALGEQIARHGDRNLDYTFYIVNTDVVNAFAVPGGFVYVNRGLIEETDDLAELAGVLAHEIAHVEERHGAEQMERMQAANLGVNLAYVLLGRPPSGVEQAALQVGGAAVFARYGREAELEADVTGVELLVRSGIHPRGMVTFFQELLQERQRRPSQLEQWFSTHPLTEERIQEVQRMIEQVPRNRLANLRMTSSGYQDFKARLARIARN